MKIGVVVDGIAEYRSLGNVFEELRSESGNEFLRVLKADLQPYAPYGAMGRSCKAALMQLEGKGADRIVVLVDREDRQECPGVHAEGIRAEIAKYVGCDIEVVVKNRSFENWLIADLDALLAQPARYTVSNNMRGAVRPNKADNVVALDLLKRAAKGGYAKVSDSDRILCHASILRVAVNSRSFRRFLRVTGVALYRLQSLHPA